MMPEESKHCHNGCVTVACENTKFVNIKYYDRLQIALKIRDIKSNVGEINDGVKINSSNQGQISSTKNSDMTWKILQRSPYPGQTEIVGFKAQNEKLIDWLEDGQENCNVVVVVGMAGQGKTTLVKQIFDNNEVIGKFESSVWIHVSEFDSPKEFFRVMLTKFYQQTGENDNLPHGFHTMGLESLKNGVKKHLRKKRYVLFFDDVWNNKFWQEIEHTVSDNENGSRIIITTRNKEVAKTCKRSSVVDVKVHEMQPLTHKESLKLFCQVALKLDIDKKDCPNKYVKLSSDIVKTCDGLPLGIVAIGKHVPGENPYTFKWKSIIQEAGITETLGLSYDYLPDHLKPCLLYFGIYPQDFAVKSKRLIKQWIAEGFVFVSHENDKTLEEVAEDYLASLIDRNLVQVSSFTIDGNPRSCRVHYLVHDMILRKSEELSFCQFVNEDNRSDVTGIVTRHLSIATKSTEELPGFFDHLADEIQSSFIRSLHFFTKEKLPQHFVSRIPKKYKTLKVLDFENAKISYDFDDLGDLIYLKYLSFRNTQVQSIPKSIGKLMNLESLDLR
ncbi:disease resistance protein, partial [Trifolium medium]|nr:disease resistance protein [Trifolium medium]